MAEDSRRAWVEVIARLGRETQFHIDERYRHFRITDAVTIVISVLLAVSQQMDSMDWRIGYMEPITAHMTSIGTNMPRVAAGMDTITVNVGGIDRDMAPLGHGMLVIDQRVHSMLGAVAAIRNSVHQFAGPMGAMNPFMP